MATKLKDPPRVWEDFYKAATQLVEIKDVLFRDRHGHMAKHLLPPIHDCQHELETAAYARFGPLGRLSLARASASEARSVLPTPAAVLVFSIHSILLHFYPKLEATSGEGGLLEAEWPLSLPVQWSSSSGFALSYKNPNLTVRADLRQQQ
jgi:hypothetical protein